MLCRLLSRLHESPEVREALFGATLSVQEEVSPSSEASSAVLASALALLQEGQFYPVGGAAALERSLSATITAAGGSVHSNVEVVGIEMSGPSNKPKASGVRIVLPASADQEQHSHATITAEMSITSGLGAICTYTRLLPAQHLSLAVKQQLSTLTEARPKVSGEWVGIFSCVLTLSRRF